MSWSDAGGGGSAHRSVGRAVFRVGSLLALASVLVARDARADATAGRYQLGSSSDGSMFVLDSTSGRVWRYDRPEDAWFLYDLQALEQVPGRATGARKRAGAGEGHALPGETAPTPEATP